MQNISRRELLSASATIALINAFGLEAVEAAYSKIGPTERAILKGADLTNQVKKNYGPDRFEKKDIAASKEQIKQFQINIQTISNYFNHKDVPNNYVNHYVNQWRDKSFWEGDHEFYCPCCYIVLWHLCKGTVLHNSFRRRYFKQERFTWHYEVTWSESTFGSRHRYLGDYIEYEERHVHYAVDEFSRISVYDEVRNEISRETYGWVYYENNRMEVIDLKGRRARGFRPIIGSRPDFLV